MRKRNKKLDENGEEIEFTIGSGNIYKDFGFPNPEEANTKADLAMLITAIIEEKNITQDQAAQLIGIDQPKISKITRGLLSEFTIERLMRFILRLGFDIDILPKPHKIQNTQPSIHVRYPRLKRKQIPSSIL